MAANSASSTPASSRASGRKRQAEASSDTPVPKRRTPASQKDTSPTDGAPPSPLQLSEADLELFMKFKATMQAQRQVAAASQAAVDAGKCLNI